MKYRLALAAVGLPAALYINTHASWQVAVVAFLWVFLTGSIGIIWGSAS